MIQIKRLKQAGKEFVPITLSEAVVVNVSDFAGFENTEITTLDKVLEQYCGLTEYAITALSNINLNEYQKKLIAGNGIVIDEDGTISVENVVDNSISYKIDTALPDPPTEDHLNVIYLIPTEFEEEDGKNMFDEYICYKDGENYLWEKIGSIPSTVNLDGLLTKAEFDDFLDTAIMCEPVKDSSGKEIEINIDMTKLPNLYDNY